MAQATQNYKRSLKGSIGAGMGSVFGGSGKTYYILEHKVSSKYHKAGESQEIIVDQIEMGRDSKCQVRFDESFSTVSRRHAAIVRSGDRWKLVQLSDTNSTFLNGKKIQTEWYLQNGDEIQLAVNGPKLGFIVPTGKKATVGSIGLSRRLSLFRQQALTPYKRAITILSVILVLVLAGGAYALINQGNSLKKLQEEQANLIIARDNLLKMNNVDSVKLAELEKKLNKNQAKIIYYTNRDQTKGQTKDQGGNTNVKDTANVVSPIPPTSPTPAAEVSDISSCNQYVYAIFLDEMTYKLSDGEEQSIFKLLGIDKSICVGTGFMLNDGRFVTARHILEPWYFYNKFRDRDAKDFYQAVNFAAFHNGTISTSYTVISPTNNRYSFTNEQVIRNTNGDRVSNENYRGKPTVFTIAGNDRYDWVYYQTNETGGLKYDNALSTGLPQGTPLVILSYQGGIGIGDIYHVKPTYSSCITSGNGLNSDGLILVSNIESGSSGGPILVKKDGGYVVVGLYTGKDQIIGQKGVIVPISEVSKH